MRALARRIQHLDAEVDEHDRVLRDLLDEAAPQLIAERGIGYITAAEFYVAWSHPGRCRSEAAFARLGGTAPVEATSGQNQTRHRLSRGGDRQLNRALHLVAVTKRRCDPTTQAYIARRVWRLLEHPKNDDSSGRVRRRATADQRSAGVKGGRRPAQRTLDTGPVDRVASNHHVGSGRPGRNLLALDLTPASPAPTNPEDDEITA